MEKHYYYAALIHDQIASMFSNESDNHISREDLLEEDNATAFWHALGTLAPLMIINKLMEGDRDLLQFNHDCNRLIMQFARPIEDGEPINYNP